MADQAEVDGDSGPFADLERRVEQRQPVSVLDLGDYDHDGWATEFVLHVGNMPCGKQLSVLVGISKARRKLHAFGTAEHSDRPLVLYTDHWTKLLAAQGPIRFVMWTCGDHGSERQNETEVRVDARGLHATEDTFDCQVTFDSKVGFGDARGKPLSRKHL
jgi:hypothetical protein